jgi:hypothetical protein
VEEEREGERGRARWIRLEAKEREANGGKKERRRQREEKQRRKESGVLPRTYA